MKHPKGYWKNRDNMMDEAKKYSTKEEFQKGNLSAFLAAYKYGYIDERVKLKACRSCRWSHDFG